MTPDRLAAAAAAILAEAGDSRVAAQGLTYFKPWEKIRLHGVPAPLLRRLEREIHRRVDGSWDVDRAARFCELMIRRPHLECKHMGPMLLSRYQDRFDRGLFRRVERWLAEGSCASWAAVDGLCPAVVTPLLIRFPGLKVTMRRWRRSRVLWVRRASAVALVPLARRGQALAPAYETAAALLDDDEDLIHKAAGWLLREAGKTDPDRLAAFLLRQGPRVPRTTLRYAIERMPPARRRDLLARTRRTT